MDVRRQGTTRVGRIRSRTTLIAMLLVGSMVAMGTLAMNSASGAQGDITTVAGNGTSGYSGDGGPATAAMVAGPSGVGAAKGGAGGFFIADTFNLVVRRVDSSGTITTVAGNGTFGYSGDGGPATQAMIGYPNGVATDAAGNLFIADSSNVIRRVDATTQIITTVAGNGTGGYSGDGGPATQAMLRFPSEVTFDAAGNLYIADRFNSAVRRVDAATQIITTVAGGTYGYDGDGGLATQAALGNPTDVVVDAAGNLFIADFDNYVIRRVDATTGIISTFAGGGNPDDGVGDNGPATGAFLNGPVGVALDAAADLFIADNVGDVRKVDAVTQIITTVAGRGSPADDLGDNGPATAAVLSNPLGIDITSSGDLLIADLGNNRIRSVQGVAAPAPVDVSAVTGSAFGYSAPNSVLFGVPQPPVGPVPTVTLPASGSATPVTATAPSGRVAYGPGILFTSGPIDVSTQGTTGPMGSVTSTAHVTTVPTEQTAGEILYAGDIRATCTASETGISGSTTLAGPGDAGHTSATLRTSDGNPDVDGDETYVDLPANPPPNLTIPGNEESVGDTFRVVFNEQIVNPDGSLTINAVHEYLLGPTLTGDLYIGQVTCGVVPPPSTSTTSSTSSTSSTSTSSTSTSSTTSTTVVLTSPTIDYLTPQVSRTAGATPVLIHGSRFLGTTSVTFGNAPATKFNVIDDNLITALSPSAAAAGATDNTSVAVTVTTDRGSDTGTNTGDTRGLYYTDATITVSPNTGLHVPPNDNSGDTVTLNISGYQPNVGSVALLANPLLGFLEGGPAFADNGFRGPPPYAHPYDFNVSFDANGSVTDTKPLFGVAGGQRYDPRISCPVTQETADFGLGRCEIIVGQVAVGTLERYVGFAGDPTPAAPTLGLSKSTAAVGDTVGLNGVHWNASPFFGSSTSQTNPGETQLKVQLCKADLSACTSESANASVDLTRYQSSSTTAPIIGVFSGTNLTGSFTVADTAGCAPNCVVRVQQEGFDPSTGGGPTGQFISATAPLSVVLPDTTAPACAVTARRAGPPKQLDLTAQDTGSGLASITVISISNGTVNVPPFTPGTTSPVVVTATKTDQTKPTVFNVDVTDIAGNTTHCR